MKRAVVVSVLASLTCGVALAGAARAESPPPRGEDEIFGEPATPPASQPPATPSTPSGTAVPSKPGEEVFGEPGANGEPSTRPRDTTFDAIREDPLAIGGQLYLRSMVTLSDRGSAGSQTFSMPHLLDLYLDARPEERVRGFISGRLSYDPTVGAGSTDQLGQSRESTSIVLDQLWLKTDIARRVFLTVGQERVKWGATRLWNPNDFVNAQRKDPLTLFDERTGIPLIKLHVPADTWNIYLLGLFGGASTLESPGVAFRVEKAFASAELALSGVAGKGRRTAFGLDLSTALGPFDLTAEVSLTDERDTLEYTGTLDFDTFETPTGSPRGKWIPRVSAGIQYAFKPNDDDVMYLGLEAFYNPAGYDDPALYPWLIVQGAFTPFYLGKAYLGLSWVVPQPGNWDDSSFNVSALGNLSDSTYLVRLDFSQTLHTRLKLEAYAQTQFGKRGGELHFALEIPEIPPIPEVLPDGIGPISVPATSVLLGVNLRLSI